MRRTASSYFTWGGLLGVVSVVGLVALAWADPASAQISTAFDLTGLGTRSPVEIALSLINWMLGILALVAVVFILYGGFLWLTSAGSEDKIEQAKRVLINAGIGLLIILAAWGIVLYILTVLLGATGAGNVNGGSGCTDCYGDGFPPSGSTFYVRNTDPRDEEEDVVLCTDIYVLFSKDIDTTTVTASSLSSDNPTFYLRAVDSSTLVEKAGNGVGCSVNTDCASTLCDSSTLTCTGDNVAGTIELDDLDSGETTDHFSFLPSSDFESNTTYVATVAGGSSGVLSETSTGALSMDQDYTFIFTTGTSTDTTSPTVEEVSGSSPFPSEGETDVCLNTPINYQFSEAIRTYTVDDDTSFLVSADSTLPSTNLVDLRSFDFGGDREYAMTRPTNALTANSTYYSELYGGDIDSATGAFSNVITDACGNPLDGDFDGAAEGNSGGDDYFSPAYDFNDDGTADDPLNWQTGDNASCIPLIEAISPTNEYYGYGDDPTTTVDDSDSTSIAITGEYLSPNPEVIFNDTIYSSTSDLSCFDQELPPNEETVCFLSASLSEDTTKLPVGSQDGDVRVVVADEGSQCLFDEDSDGEVSCAFTVDSPYIDYMDPHESAPGDYVTIGGENFGDNEGFVYFRADEATVLAGYPEYVVADLPDSCGDTWSDTQVVVVVPDDYPVGTELDVQLETEDGYWSGFTYFTVSDTDRPSLCSMAPECNDAGAQSTTLTGKKLGSSGIVYYGTGVGTSTSWSTNSITAVSPGDITDGDYYVTVEVNGITSNGLEYNIPCPADDISGTPTGDSTFYVRATDPEDDETDVTLCTDVYALFSDDITISSASTSSFYLQVQGGLGAGTSCSDNSDCASGLCSGTCQGDTVSGSIELDSDASTNGTDHISFLPSTDFEENTTYLGTIVGGSSGVLGEDGTAMDDDHTFTFTTGTTTDTVPPYVVESSSSPYPADGATDVCLNTAVAFSFSEAMRTYTFDDSNSVLIASSSDFGTASLENLQAFDFGADRDSATTRVLNSLDSETVYYSRLYGGDLQGDGTYDNVVTDACGNPLDGDVDGTSEGAHVDDYLGSADTNQPIDWTTGTTAECSPIITSISPTSEYYGVSGETDDYLSIEGFYLTPNPDIVFYQNQYSSDGEDTCFDTDTPPDVSAECYDSLSSDEHELLSKVPVGSEDGSLSVTVAGLNSTCSFDADGDGSTSCQISVNSPHIDYVSPSDAAAGDYVTIGGTNFGSSTGTVYFRAADGTDVEAELPPASCGDTWTDTQIVVIVPSDFAVGTALDVQVQTSSSLGGYYSNLEDFEVSDANRPSVCSVSPSCHDSAGQSATITGKKFGSTTGTVNYGDATGSSSTAWSDTSITAVAPSDLAQDEYYLTVSDSSGNESNGVSYSIPCNNAPEVVEVNTCTESSGIYPLPNPLPDEEEACINSDIEVMFDMDMDESTFTTSTLTLVECNTVASGDDDPFSASSCSTTNLIQSSFIDQTETVTYDTNTYYGFRIDPDDLDSNTWYQMTISTGVESAAGVGLAEDYTYHFKVRDSSEPCAISTISVQPTSITHNAYCADANGDGDTSDSGECPRTDGDYSGSAYSAECLLLDSDSYSWSWTITNPTGGDCTDPDDDGLSTADEASQGTDATDSDSDDDTYEDGWEVNQGTDPTDSTSAPSSSGDLTADDICEDTETCVEVGGTGTCTSIVGDFSSSGSGDFTSSGSNVTVYPGGNDNYNQGTADVDAVASGLTDDALYRIDFGYCETDRDCELSCAGSTCDDSINRCTPVVNSFSPTSGELGTWVTIDGCMFGPSKGNVQWEDGSTVIDTDWPDEILCGDTWSDTQIVAQFPTLYDGDADGVADDTIPTSSYAINVINTYDLEDTTSTEFQVNTDVHAGLCRVSPESESIGESVNLYGQNFDVTEGTVSFNPTSGSTSPSARVSADPANTTWGDTQITTLVPEGAQTGLSAASEEGVKVVLSDGTTESNAVDFTVSYEAPTIESSDPADGDVDICPNAALNVTFSEEMTGFSLGSSGTVRLYRVSVSGSGAEVLTRTPLSPLVFDGSTLTITPRSSLAVSSDYRIVLISETSSQIRGVNSGLNLADGTTEIDFTTSSIICTPDHVEVTMNANELEENLDLDSSGVIEDAYVNMSSWTYTAADEAREWTARMYDSNDNELANVADLSWTWSWSPLYDETACVNAVWVSTVEGDTDLDLLDDEYEDVIGTDPEDYDTDGDGYGDGWELEIDTDPLDQNSYPNATDVADHDGLLISEETQYGTDYTEYDTDGDGYGDGWEVLNGSDPLDETEFPTVTDPTTSADADADGLFEVTGATEESDVAITGERATDTDGDGYGDVWETENATDPNSASSYPTTSDPGTSASDNDTDGDSWLDGWEVLFDSDPSDSASVPAIADPGTDNDGDGLGSVEEAAEGTNNSDYDSDDDGFGDGWEVDHATDPSDAASYPTTAETLTGLDESQTYVSGDSDNETSSVAVTANARTGWSGTLSTSAAVAVQFCDGDSWQYSDSNQNMLLWYCDENHTLPDLEGPAVTAGSSSTDYIRQYLFPSEDDANDTIGIRVYSNSTDFLTPEEWVLANVPNAGDLSLSSTTIDGYPAVRSTNAVYVDATYVGTSSSRYRLYNNMYLITWTQGGDAETIAAELLDNWHFNTNVDDSAVTDSISGPDQGCVYSSKSKLQRDTERVIELYTMSDLLEDQYSSDSEYPLPKSDTLASYIEHITNSVWPSWQGALGNVLGEALGEDPVNAFLDATDADGNSITDYLNADATNECPYSPDTNEFYDTSGTCWDNVNLDFYCPDNSFVYLYKRDETDSTDAWLYGHMEYTSENAATDIYYPTTRYNTYASSSTNYSPCGSSNDCSCFNFAINSENGATFSGGE